MIDQLDQEDVTVLALLAWATATNRPITSTHVAALSDRNGVPIGITEARAITESLKRLGIASVLGMGNENPLSIFLGGFQPAYARRQDSAFRSNRSTASRGAVTAPRTGPQGQGHERPSSEPKATPGLPMEHSTGKLAALKTTAATPAFVPKESKRLRTELNWVTKNLKDPVKEAAERKRILSERIRLYERWLDAEPGHPELRSWLDRKYKALPELEQQLEQVRAK
ncbi:hypothetical protein [Streptomyces cucumeris]|uniref:hypothetical protein n=1 Tax=Streptomyces cucumeris TaxID=2962890 RepID=UPI0020C87CED|nr:hypothetical protein [Streptomyces sp. NEAU-Y11]MCP9209620.1 hypothetical protein [Streptomyces sp. NEAU-Y11]